MDVISHFAARFERSTEEELSLEEYLAECKRNPLAYATAAERMLKAIGEPQMMDTRNDSRLSRHLRRTRSSRSTPPSPSSTAWRTRSSRSSSYFRHAAQGLEEKKQILLSAGPGGRRQELDRRAPQALMEQVPFYAHQGLAGERDAARACSMPSKTARSSRASTASRAATCSASCRRGR